VKEVAPVNNPDENDPFIWSVADGLFGDYKLPARGVVILPEWLLRHQDCLEVPRCL
jgi:hypothetical protein